MKTVVAALIKKDGKYLIAKRASESEGLDAEKTQSLLDHYVSTGRIPRTHELGDVLMSQPSVLQLESASGSNPQYTQLIVDRYPICFQMNKPMLVTA